jgi:hypothetical protein
MRFAKIANRMRICVNLSIESYHASLDVQCCCFRAIYDPSDGFVLQNLNGDELATWRERFQHVCEGFFGNAMPNLI